MKWLLDEMLPPSAAARLRELDHDAISVHEVRLGGAPDELIFDYALAEGRVLVTENFAHFSNILEQRFAEGKECAPVVFVRKSDFPRAGALAVHLARHLDSWAARNAQPYAGAHWP